MAYQVDKFNGTFLVSVADGTIDTTTDLRFVGKNYAGYGEVQNENFLHLLESFSNTTAPPKVVTGQIWYDSANQKLKFYNGSRFKLAGGAEVSATAPSGLASGDFWWDSSAKQLYAWNGVDFTLVGPVSSPDLGTSTVSPDTVKGTVSTTVGPHTILKIIADSKVIGIFSKTAFTLDNAQNTIEDFSVIKKGFTLAKSQTGVSTDDYIMWGTTQNAIQLGGVGADQFLRKGDNAFTEEVSFADTGIQIGDGNDIRIRIENGDEAIFENRLGNSITFRISVAETTDERDIAVITSTGVVPADGNAYTLGSSLSKWSNVYSTVFTGNLTGNATGTTTGSHYGNVYSSDNQIMIDGTTKQIGYAGANIVGTLTGSVTGSAATATNSGKLNDLEPSVAVPGSAVATIPVRDATGNIYATQFIGIADKVDRTFIDKTDALSDPTWNDGTTSTKYRTARLSATAYSIAARDSSGNITANLFNGTATAARYADLAEKYTTAIELVPGTAVAVCTCEEHEVEPATASNHCIGVVSTNPAIMMNSDAEGQYIALTGRVPVRVKGAVKKGQVVYAWIDGVCTTVATTAMVGVALESNADDAEKLVECVLKV